ncbi:hypothetical protein EDM57_14395 [Brevibacillus gelatini]|uniref:DUF1002 domain-containing protein n=1 Tax=Brevibacillus gelatini TaxID=1655277 RepID=A0A3M8AX38_9BACL|nr:hypothetical protein [Brevibacillus gelatini]RNB55682.1 hypothetical protein EDM57_14395 [Brevibacillus gelatini]
MDIGKLLNMVRSIPKDKLKTDAGLKEVIRDLGKKVGKNFTDKELNGYVEKFRHMSRTENVGSLLNKLSKKGVSAKDIDSLKKRFK